MKTGLKFAGSVSGGAGQEGREVFFRQQVGDGGDLGIVVHHLVDQCLEQRCDCLRGVLEFPEVDVCGVSGQGRGKPDVRFVEERFDVRASFLQFTHVYVYRGQRQRYSESSSPMVTSSVFTFDRS